MADRQTYTSRENGALWIAPNGPNTKPEYLPCHDLEDISESNGSMSLIQCVDERGQYKTIGETIAPPEPTTTTLGTYFGRVADWIETVACPFPLYVMMRSGGKASVFENWERGMLLQVRNVANITRSGLVRISEDTAAMHTFDIEAYPGVIDFFRLSSVAQEPEGNVTSLRFLDDPACWDQSGSTRNTTDVGYATTEAGTGVTAEVLVAPNWTATAADPFAVDEDIADLALFKISRDKYRILVVRGTTDAGDPMEVAYSDDEGANWTRVDVGATDGEFAIKKGALYGLDKYNIFLVSNLGRIYKSEDGGQSWATVEDASITATAYNAVHFLNPDVGYAVGLGGLVVRTLDGGRTWGQVPTAAGSNALYSVFVLGQERVWVGSTNGVMYYTTDGGQTWTSRTLPGGAANVNDIQFPNDYVGYVANGTSVKFTITGGYSWETIEDTANLLTGPLVSVNYDSPRLVYSASAGEIIQSSL
jgi:photosystem II stability/assembly factor-like uncharacterized protein